MRDHEKETPLYVLCRKWVQNDPETELMLPKLMLGVDSEAQEGAAAAPPNLPPVQSPSGEEAEEAEQPPPEEPPLPQQPKDVPSLDVRTHAFLIAACFRPCTVLHTSPASSAGSVSTCSWTVPSGKSGSKQRMVSFARLYC